MDIKSFLIYSDLLFSDHVYVPTDNLSMLHLARAPRALSPLLRPLNMQRYHDIAQGSEWHS